MFRTLFSRRRRNQSSLRRTSSNPEHDVDVHDSLFVPLMQVLIEDEFFVAKIILEHVNGSDEKDVSGLASFLTIFRTQPTMLHSFLEELMTLELNAFGKNTSLIFRDNGSASAKLVDLLLERSKTKLKSLLDRKEWAQQIVGAFEDMNASDRSVVIVPLIQKLLRQISFAVHCDSDTSVVCFLLSHQICNHLEDIDMETAQSLAVSTLLILKMVCPAICNLTLSGEFTAVGRKSIVQFARILQRLACHVSDDKNLHESDDDALIFTKCSSLFRSFATSICSMGGEQSEAEEYSFTDTISVMETPNNSKILVQEWCSLFTMMQDKMPLIIADLKKQSNVPARKRSITIEVSDDGCSSPEQDEDKGKYRKYRNFHDTENRINHSSTKNIKKGRRVKRVSTDSSSSGSELFLDYAPSVTVTERFSAAVSRIDLIISTMNQKKKTRKRRNRRFLDMSDPL